MVGRKNKPKAIKILEGNPGKRPLSNEPMPEKILLSCPEYLKKDKIAFNEWNRIAPELYKLGLLTIADKVSLEIYCSQYSIYRKALDEISKEGLVTTNIRKGNKANPQLAIAREAAKIIKAIAIEFGLTPSSRGRISLPNEVNEDPLEEMFRRG
ncbi:MAG: phage terminase small subunit P27 family [Methanofastidiosum sp.]